MKLILASLKSIFCLSFSCPTDWAIEILVLKSVCTSLNRMRNEFLNQTANSLELWTSVPLLLHHQVPSSSASAQPPSANFFPLVCVSWRLQHCFPLIRLMNKGVKSPFLCRSQRLHHSESLHHHGLGFKSHSPSSTGIFESCPRDQPPKSHRPWDHPSI